MTFADLLDAQPLDGTYKNTRHTVVRFHSRVCYVGTCGLCALPFYPRATADDADAALGYYDLRRSVHRALKSHYENHHSYARRTPRKTYRPTQTLATLAPPAAPAPLDSLPAPPPAPPASPALPPTEAGEAEDATWSGAAREGWATFRKRARVDDGPTARHG